MGMYINHPSLDADEYLLTIGRRVDRVPTWADVPVDETAVVVKDNLRYKAAAVAYSQNEHACFFDLDRNDFRPTRWYLVKTAALVGGDALPKGDVDLLRMFRLNGLDA